MEWVLVRSSPLQASPLPGASVPAPRDRTVCRDCSLREQVVALSAWCSIPGLDILDVRVRHSHGYRQLHRAAFQAISFQNHKSHCAASPGSQVSRSAGSTGLSSGRNRLTLSRNHVIDPVQPTPARPSTCRYPDPVRPATAEHRPRPAAGSKPNPPLRSPIHLSGWPRFRPSLSNVVDKCGLFSRGRYVGARTVRVCGAETEPPGS